MLKACHTFWENTEFGQTVTLVVFLGDGSEGELRAKMNLAFPLLLFRNEDLILYYAKLENFLFFLQILSLSCCLMRQNMALSADSWSTVDA